jgi:hypothetical protein
MKTHGRQFGHRQNRLRKKSQGKKGAQRCTRSERLLRNRSWEISGEILENSK